MRGISPEILTKSTLLAAASTAVLLAGVAAAQAQESVEAKSQQPIATQNGPAAAPAQQGAAAPLSQGPEGAPATTVQGVIITGSRIRRAATDTPAPVAVISSQDITDRGFVTAGEALDVLTTNVPQFPEANGSGSPSGPGQTFPNLFNLGPGRTLTLVDGHRFVSSATPVTGTTSGAGSAVDTNLIPVGLIDRVEVVEAGGAAVYGSDAIAGVVNYILKRNFNGVQLDAQAGISGRGDYPEDSVRGTFGTDFADHKGNIAVDLEWSKTQPLEFEDRPLSALGRTTLGKYQVLNSRFWEFNNNGVIFTLPVPVPIPPCGFQNCFARVGGVPQQFSADGQSVINYNPGVNPINGSSNLTPPFATGGQGFDYRDLQALYTGVERYSANFLGHYDFTDHLRLSGSFLYGHTRGDDPNGTQGFSQTILNPAASGFGPIVFNSSNPFLSAADIATLNTAAPGFAAGRPLFLSKNFPDILPTHAFITNTDSIRGLVSLDGDFNLGDRNFYYSASYSRGDVRSEQTGWDVDISRFQNAINATRDSSGQIVCAINSPTVTDAACAPIDPFGVNVSAAARAYVSVPVGYVYHNTQDDALATLGGDIVRLPAGMAKFSLAYEHRHETASFSPSEAQQLGLVGSGVPTPSTHGAYGTNEYSGEVLIPLLGDGFNVPLARHVDFSGQYRLVDNSVAGSESVWGVGLRWEIFPDLTFRASRSRNFRAPTLYQLFAPQSTDLAGGIQDPCDMRYINAGPSPATRQANCLALFNANPLYGTGSAGGAPVGASAAQRLATFQDTAANFTTAEVTSGGNPALKNEVSNTTTFGVVFQPHWVPGHLTFVGDYISIDLLNGLTGFTPTNFEQSCFDAPGANGPTCSFFTRDQFGNTATAVSTTYNAALIHYQGETYNFDYQFPVEWIARRPAGNLDLNLELTHNDVLKTNVAGAITQVAGTVAEPRWVVRGDLRYNVGPLRLIYEVYYLPSAYAAQGANLNNNPNPVVGSNIKQSLTAVYTYGRYQFRAGIIDIADRMTSYPSLSYGDILGRRFFVGLTARY